METTSKYNKSEIMKEAHRLYKWNRPFNWSFSKSLTMAWRNTKIRIENARIEEETRIKEEARIEDIYAANRKASANMTSEEIHYATMASYYAAGVYSGD